jgi:hypothetical protein
MRPPSTAIAAVALLFITMDATMDARASCVASPTPLCATWQQTYDAVFDGTVVSIRRIDLPDQNLRGRLVGNRLSTFQVHDQVRKI